jgi:predicted DNA-binding ArsR family transcriptional regulator
MYICTACGYDECKAIGSEPPEQMQYLDTAGDPVLEKAWIQPSEASKNSKSYGLCHVASGAR